MERVTKQQLECALAEADAAERAAAPLRSMLGGIHWPAALAAEVRALQVELQEYVERCDGYGSVCAEHEATIARVEALLPQLTGKDKTLVSDALRGEWQKVAM